MNKRLRAKWIKALRSGDYKQTRGYLFVSKNKSEAREEPPGFCCLGVLRRISQGKVKTLPRRDLLTPESCGISLDTQKYLAAMNDGGHNFNSIADFIEALL